MLFLSPKAKRPDLSLLEVLKELASQWNGMNKQEKQKFAVIAKESEEKQELSAISFSPTDPLARRLEGEEAELGVEEGEEVGEGPSMEGAVFEVGDSNSGADYYQVHPLGDQSDLPGAETLYQEQEQQHCEKSLNQNVFGQKVMVLSKPSEGLVYDEEAFSVSSDVFPNEDGAMHAVEGYESGAEEIGEVVQFEEAGASGDSMETGELQFEGEQDSGAVVFDSGSDGAVVFGSGSEMEMEGGTIFFLPGMVGQEQLEEAMGEP